ncbi:hypothetical protein NKG94_08000 [Micromonospora sp. M12]
MADQRRERRVERRRIWYNPTTAGVANGAAGTVAGTKNGGNGGNAPLESGLMGARPAAGGQLIPPLAAAVTVVGMELPGQVAGEPQWVPVGQGRRRLARLPDDDHLSMRS